MSHDSDSVAANLTSESQGNGVEANTDTCSAEDRYVRGAKGDDAKGGDAQGGEGVAAGCLRRRLLQLLAAAGIGTVPFQRALAQQVADAGTVTPEMIERAEWISGLTLDAAVREETARALSGAQQAAAGLRGIPLTNDVGPALHFRVAAETPSDAVTRCALEFAPIEMERPTGDDALAFLTVAELSSLLRTRKVSSVELTKLYLARLEKFDPVLHCVVANTAELALEQAAQADQELAAGPCRGPLHGIPWGAKDLITYPPFKTTWGAHNIRNDPGSELPLVAIAGAEPAHSEVIVEMGNGVIVRINNRNADGLGYTATSTTADNPMIIDRQIIHKQTLCVGEKLPVELQQAVNPGGEDSKIQSIYLVEATRTHGGGGGGKDGNVLELYALKASNRANDVRLAVSGENSNCLAANRYGAKGETISFGAITGKGRGHREIIVVVNDSAGENILRISRPTDPDGKYILTSSRAKEPILVDETELKGRSVSVGEWMPLRGSEKKGVDDRNGIVKEIYLVKTETIPSASGSQHPDDNVLDRFVKLAANKPPPLPDNDDIPTRQLTREELGVPPPPQPLAPSTAKTMIGDVITNPDKIVVFKTRSGSRYCVVATANGRPSAISMTQLTKHQADQSNSKINYRYNLSGDPVSKHSSLLLLDGDGVSAIPITTTPIIDAVVLSKSAAVPGKLLTPAELKLIAGLK